MHSFGSILEAHFSLLDSYRVFTHSKDVGYELRLCIDEMGDYRKMF